MQEEPEEQDVPEDHHMPEESGTEGPTAENGTPAWAVPIPDDGEHETLELQNRVFKRGQQINMVGAKSFDDQ